MKKFILLFFATFILFSCEKSKTPEELLIQKAESELKSKMNDPSSYEFVSFEVDTMDIHSARMRIHDINTAISKTSDSAVIDLLKEKINFVKERYKSELEDSEAIKYKLMYRGKNGFGALTLGYVSIISNSNFDYLGTREN